MKLFVYHDSTYDDIRITEGQRPHDFTVYTVFHVEDVREVNVLLEIVRVYNMLRYVLLLGPQESVDALTVTALSMLKNMPESELFLHNSACMITAEISACIHDALLLLHISD